MKEKIVKDGTKIILFALDTEDTSVTGWSTMDGKLMYKCHYKELDGTEGDLDNLVRKNFEVIPNKFINLTPQHSIMVQNTIHQVKLLVLLISLATFAVVFPQCSMVRLRISQNQKRAQFISCQHWYLLQQKRKVERMQLLLQQVILIALEDSQSLYLDS